MILYIEPGDNRNTMNKIDIYQADAFTDKLFGGNPAAVCLLDDWPDDRLLQSIAAENNLAETAFIIPKEKHFEIRWFTPTVEVELCGHATLASAFVLFNCLEYKESEVVFLSRRSGVLRVFQKGQILFLDFPTDKLTAAAADTGKLKRCIGIEPIEMYRGKTDYVAVIAGEEEVRHLSPDMTEISKLPVRGLIVTAKGDEVDFVSRFFAPQSGIDEDPATGSAHTSLIPLWSKKLKKREMKARQLSERGGSLTCIDNGERCLIGGQVRLYMTGQIRL